MILRILKSAEGGLLLFYDKMPRSISPERGFLFPVFGLVYSAVEFI